MEVRDIWTRGAEMQKCFCREMWTRLQHKSNTIECLWGLIDAINYTDYTVYLQQDMKLYGENGNSATWNQKVWGGTNQIHNKSKWYVAECRSKRKQEEEDQTFIMSFTHHTRATPEDLVGCSFFVSVDTFCLGSVLNSCPAMASKEKMRIAVEAGITHQVEAESDSVICVDLLKLTATYFLWDDTKSELLEVLQKHLYKSRFWVESVL